MSSYVGKKRKLSTYVKNITGEGIPAPKRRAVSTKYKTRAVSVPSTVIAEKTFVKMRYFDTFTLGGSASSYYEFRMNSIFDPQKATGVNQGQPTGFATYASMYNKYRVHACSVEAWFSRIGTDSTTNYPLVAYIKGFTDGNDHTITAANKDPITEGQFCKYKILPGSMGTSTTKIQSSCHVKNYFKLKYITPTQDPQLLSSEFTTNPSACPLFAAGVIAAGPYDGLTPSNGVGAWMSVKITYYVECTGRKDISDF